MSSAAYLTYDEPITREQWDTFRAAWDGNPIEFSPNTVGRNTFYSGRVEIIFGKENWATPPTGEDGRIQFDKIEPPTEAKQITVSTYWMGEATPEVAALVRRLWFTFGGALELAPELQQFFDIQPSA